MITRDPEGGTRAEDVDDVIGIAADRLALVVGACSAALLRFPASWFVPLVDLPATVPSDPG